MLCLLSKGESTHKVDGYYFLQVTRYYSIDIKAIEELIKGLLIDIICFYKFFYSLLYTFPTEVLTHTGIYLRYA